MISSEKFIPSARKVCRCAFTIDVEDWYQSSVDFGAPISERVLRNVDRVRTMLDETCTCGTFFVQGLVARKFPQLVRELLADGHEVQSHGHTHRPLFRMNRYELRTELEHARKSVEDAGGVKVTAFRAPDFSIRQENLWALDVLEEVGFKVDSSIFPMALKRYGIANTPLAPHHIRLGAGRSIVEAPVAVWEWRGIRMPVAGGGYFRLLPRIFLRHAIKRMLAFDQPVIIYCHPYEFCPEELEDYRGLVPQRFLWLQGLGRSSFRKGLAHLIRNFEFGRFDEVLSGCAIQ
jgi:polysaccharide deacetylase family protein (PEP-CTERM system associated)